MKFRPEDFHTGYCVPDERMSPEEAAAAANAKLQQWISEAPVVYAAHGPCTGWRAMQVSPLVDTATQTHTARLVCIEEIEKGEGE